MAENAGALPPNVRFIFGVERGDVRTGMISAHDMEAMRDFRLSDVMTFLAVQRCGSVSKAARELKVTPSHVSKVVARLERLLQVTLLSRTTHGVILSKAAQALVPQLQDILERIRQLEPRPDSRGARERQLTIAGPSYLINLFMPLLAHRLPAIRLRGLELPPALVRTYAAENFFDVAITVSLEPLSPIWVHTHVGALRKSLFVRPSLAESLGPPPVSEERLAPIPFIGPVYSNNGQPVSVHDDCPMPRALRRPGHEAQTIGLGLALASSIDQAVFGPVVAAREHLARGAVVEVSVDGWDVRDDVYLVANGDRVLAREQRAIADVLRCSLADDGDGDGDAIGVGAEGDALLSP